MLDKRLSARKQEYDEAPPIVKDQIDLVQRRLHTIIDLKKMQLHPHCQGVGGIDCDVKLKVKKYLETKEERDKKWIGQIYPDKIFRKQLMHI